jgi:hypothetical protein
VQIPATRSYNVSPSPSGASNSCTREPRTRCCHSGNHLAVQRPGLRPDASRRVGTDGAAPFQRVGPVPQQRGVNGTVPGRATRQHQILGDELVGRAAALACIPQGPVASVQRPADRQHPHRPGRWHQVVVHALDHPHACGACDRVAEPGPHGSPTPCRRVPPPGHTSRPREDRMPSRPAGFRRAQALAETLRAGSDAGLGQNGTRAFSLHAWWTASLPKHGRGPNRQSKQPPPTWRASHSKGEIQSSGPPPPCPSRLPPGRHRRRRPDRRRIMNDVGAHRAIPSPGRPRRAPQTGHSVG